MANATKQSYWVYLKLRVKIEAEDQKQAEVEGAKLVASVEKIIPNADWRGKTGIYEIESK